jgi:hypothetical protein
MWNENDPVKMRCTHIVTWNTDYTVSWKQLVFGTMVVGTMVDGTMVWKDGGC